MNLLKTGVLAALWTAFTLAVPAQSTGPGLALSLNGTNGFATVTNASVFNFSGAFTVEAWINVNSLNIQWQAILTKGDSCWRLHRYNSSDVACFSTTSGGTNEDLPGVTPIDDGNWHHIAGVFDGAGNKYLYVDGSLDAYSNGAGTLSSNSYPLDIGENAQESGRVWDGEIDEVRIWNVALSQSQIQADMNRSLVGNEAGLVAYYRLDDGGTTITNSTGDGTLDGALVGDGAWVASTAPIGLPVLTTTGPSALNDNAAAVSGAVIPNFQETGWYFEYGTSTNYGSTTPVSTIYTGTDQSNAFLDVAQTLYGLAPDTAYHYRLVATNSAGMSLSADEAFTTLPQTLINLYTFTNTVVGGADPNGDLVLSGNTLYGTTSSGGTFGYGAIFAVHTDGSGFTNLHSLAYDDGKYPYNGLTLSDGTLYGAAWSGAAFGSGTVFALGTNGVGFTNLYNFSSQSGLNQTNTDGSDVNGDLLLVGGTLYGTAAEGGDYSVGTLFAVNTNGTGFTNLYNFGEDGFDPQGGLILSGGALYGTTRLGGTNFDGSVFAFSINNGSLTNLYSFTASSGTGGIFGYGTNSDGSQLVAGLVLSGNALYGTTEYGGIFGNGTVFRVNTDGTGFTNLYNFTALSGNENYYGANSDGAVPQGRLLLLGNTLYGTAAYGGAFGYGSVFAINTDGSGFTNLYSFSDGNDGAAPVGGLIASGNILYGTTSSGGNNENARGTVFALGLSSSAAPIPLLIQSGNHAVILSWNNPAFSLQRSPTVNGVYTNVPGASSPYTNTISGAAEFFRLKN